jgi:proton-coupled amino acid transporter
MTADEYLGKRKFGRLGDAKVESDSDEDDPDLIDKTPMTKRRVIEETAKGRVKLLGPVATFITLMKGFVCTSVVYLPKSVVNGGWAFSGGMLIFSCFLTIYCALLLLDVRKKLDLTSYTQIGTKTYGKLGRVTVDIALWGSQAGFCCAYVYFIKQNFHQILEDSFGIDVNVNILWALCFVMFTLLCFVRKISKFALTHQFAIAMIFLTMAVVIIYGIMNLSKEGSQLSTITAINPVSWSDAIGFSVYAYEGIGVILPVKEVTAVPEQYTKIVVGVIITICILFVSFGQFTVTAWGDELKTPLITD